MTTVHKRPLCLAAVLLLLLVLFTACVSKAAKAQEKIELGRKYLTELNYTEAVASFTEAIQLDPENIPAYMGRAEAYVGLEQYPEAKADYTTAIEKAAELPYTQAQAYVGRAEVNELTEELQDAESDYEAAQELLEAEDIAEKAQVEDDVLTALKKKILYARAVLCARLGQYGTAVESYDALSALGEDVKENLNALLAKVTFAKSKNSALSDGYSWLKLVKHTEYAEEIQLETMEEIMQTVAELAQTKGTDAYDEVKAILLAEDAQAAMRSLLARGYQLRNYDADGKMLAIYVNEKNWTSRGGAGTENANPTEQEINAISLDKLYVYYGSHASWDRSGEGIWYILNPTGTEQNAEEGTWEGDLKKITRTTTYQYDDSHRSVRTTDIEFCIGGTKINLHETWSTGETYDSTFNLNGPILDAKLTERRGTFYLPAGTVVHGATFWIDKEHPEGEGNYQLDRVLNAGEECGFNYAAVGSYGIHFIGR